MDKPKIVAVVGSLRRDSYNHQLALAAQSIVGDRAAFSLLDYTDVPLFNGDIEHPTPEAVRRVRAEIKAADGVWFFTPEYNHSFPGVLKNLIDWLSRRVSQTEGQALNRKPAAVGGASPGIHGTAIAQDQLVMLISYLNMRVMNSPRLVIPNVEDQLDAAGGLMLSESLPFLTQQAEAFLKFIR
jgi:chromate reductase, NAD(P)H dehydrogenase (quinone)